MNPIQLQDIEIEETSPYKYLGYNFCYKGNLTTLLEELKKRVEAAYQTVTSIIDNPTFTKI